MNCFAHALPFLRSPYFAVGCCIPDWLTAADRRCRAREKKASPYVNHRDPIVAATAAGIVQHHLDDHWFHQTPTFNELILKFAVELRDLLNNDRSMRASFVGHIIVEMLLDAYLNQKHPGHLEYFYQQVATVDPEAIQSAVNRFATQPTEKLASEIGRFQLARYLFDYATDQGIVYRINRVLDRLKLAELPPIVFDWLPGARNQVYNRGEDLLPNYPMTF